MFWCLYRIGNSVSISLVIISWWQKDKMKFPSLEIAAAVLSYIVISLGVLLTRCEDDHVHDSSDTTTKRRNRRWNREFGREIKTRRGLHHETTTNTEHDQDRKLRIPIDLDRAIQDTIEQALFQNHLGQQERAALSNLQEFSMSMSTAATPRRHQQGD